MFKGVIERPSPLSFDQSVALSSQLSKIPMVGHEQPGEVIRVAPEDVVPVLIAQKIDFMLVGAYGISGWLMQPRATQDVDVLVRTMDRGKTASALLQKYSDWAVEKCPQVWRLGKNDQVLVDIMLTNSPLHKRVFKEFAFTVVSGTKVKVPKVECAITMKFSAMTGHYRRQEKKYLDAADFVSMINKNKKLDLDLLHELAELQYSGAGAELLKYVEEARAGRSLRI